LAAVELQTKVQLLLTYSNQAPGLSRLPGFENREFDFQA